METPQEGEAGEASLIQLQEDRRETVAPGPGQMALFVSSWEERACPASCRVSSVPASRGGTLMDACE